MSELTMQQEIQVAATSAVSQALTSKEVIGALGKSLREAALAEQSFLEKKEVKIAIGIGAALGIGAIAVGMNNKIAANTATLRTHGNVLNSLGLQPGENGTIVATNLRLK